MTKHDISPWVTQGLYLFGFALVLTAAIDLGTTVWPARPTDLPWRYGFLGLAAGYLQSPTLGLVLVMGAAWLADHPRVLRMSGIASLVVALLLLASSGLFALDVLQMRDLRPAEAQAAVLTGGFFQIVKYVVAALVLVLLGIGASASARELRRAGARRRRS